MSQLQYSEFATEILSNIKNQQVGLAESEPSIDRTLGYLTAAEKVIGENPNERILITVASKNSLKLPALGEKIRPAILKERFSYVCLRKFYNCINNADIYLTPEERINFFALITWIEKTKMAI